MQANTTINSSETTREQGFGTLKGVFIPSILMIFGVIIFLRMGWIVGTAGIEWTLAIIGLSIGIVLVTMLSMAAIATNTTIGKGGVYFILSRSLGLEAGSAAGLLLYFKDCMGTAFCAIGFAECAHDLLPQFSVTTIALISLAAMTIPAYTSAALALKMQMIILVSIVLALFSLFSGSGPTLATVPPLFTADFSFWKIFAIFFPAMTGVESSIALSGTLKNPSRSLPLGAVTAIIVGGAIYFAIALFLHATVDRATLIADPLIVQHIAQFSGLILFGIWGATLSSTLGGLLGAPRTLQALAEDGVVPRFIGAEDKRTGEPKIATGITVLLTTICICYGSVNAIAPLLTMISLICYALLNLSASFEDLMGNPSWRPTFPVSWTISGMGALLCILAMLMIDSGWALITLFVLIAIFFFSKWRRLSSDWDDIRQGIFMFFLRNVIYKLAHTMPSSKSWRPNFLVFTAKPTDPTCELLSFATAITQSKGLLTVASFIPEELSKAQTDEKCTIIHKILKEHHISALVELGFAPNITSGMKTMVSNYGLGPLTPNTIVFGAVNDREAITKYTDVVHMVRQQDRNLIIVNESEFPKVGNIDIWWDHKNSSNSDLMIIFAHMLQKSKKWNQAPITIRSIAHTEEEKAKQELQFADLFSKNRLNMRSAVSVYQPRSTEEEFAKLQSLSCDAAYIFSSLRLRELEESDAAYTSYLEARIHKQPNSPTMALIMASPSINVKEVLSG